MDSKTRVRRTFDRSEPDRVPVNYLANPGIDARLKAHFGLQPNDWEGLLRALNVDLRGIGVPYVGPTLHAPVPDRYVDGCWGIRTRYIEHGSGGYWDYCDFPLRDATVDEVLAWPMPNPDDYDYSAVRGACAAYADRFVALTLQPDIINGTGMIRTMEQTLVDLVTDDPAGLAYIDRKLAILLEVVRRTLDAAEGGIDALWLGEDLGTQMGPLISLDLFRKHIRPRHEPFVALGRERGLHVMMHSCGSSSWAFDDFAEMGITVVDTLQPEAANMSPGYLKGRYGDRLAFHGCISTAGVLASGTPGDVTDDCRATLATMMPGGGYCFAPTHMIQDNTPTENAVAMYEAVMEYGRY